MTDVNAEAIVRALDAIITERNQLSDGLAKAEGRIYRVWKLHQPITHEGRKVCAHSLDDYPCPTINAIKGEPS